MRRPAATLCATFAVLAGPTVAGAHPTVEPAFITAGQRGTVTFNVPNERQTSRMSGFSVTVPPRSLSIVSPEASGAGWPGTVRGSTASWSGCCVAYGEEATFPLELQAADEPGDTHAEVRLLYPNGEHVLWQVPLTVLPGEKESGSELTILLVAGVGLVVTVGVVALLWLRRTPPAPGAS